MVAAGAAGVEVGGLQGRADRGLRAREVDVALAVDRRGAAGGVDQAEQHPQGGGLAGAVRPEEAGDPAGLDVEAQVVDGDEAAEALGEPSDLDPRPVAVVVLIGCLVVSCARSLQPSRGVRVNPPVDPAPRGGPAVRRGDGDRGPQGVRPHTMVPIMTAWLLLLLGVVLTVGTALFVAAEFSLVALDRPGAEGRRRRGARGPVGAHLAPPALDPALGRASSASP